MSGKIHFAILCAGFAISSCGTSKATPDQAASNSNNSAVASNSEFAQANSQTAGIIVCEGRVKIFHRGYPQNKVSNEKAELAFKFIPGENTPVHLWDKASNIFKEACSYDCQTMGSKNDWSLRSGHRSMREATTAMGSGTNVQEMDYRNGHLSAYEEAQVMTQMGPVQDGSTIEADCKPLTS